MLGDQTQYNIIMNEDWRTLELLAKQLFICFLKYKYLLFS